MFKIDSLKGRAVLWHLALSLLLSIVIATWLVVTWFPSPFTFAAGALTGLLIVVSVDMCLGPMLTFLLIHSKKSVRENILDGCLVAVLQFSALSYGLWQVSLARPVAVVFWQDAFYVVKAFDFKEGLKNQTDLHEFSHESVPVIYARQPILRDELKQMEDAIRNGIVPYEQVNLYRPLKDGLEEVRNNQLDLPKLQAKYPEITEQLDLLVAKDLQAKFIYSRLYSEYGNFIVVLDSNGKLVGLLSLSI